MENLREQLDLYIHAKDLPLEADSIPFIDESIVTLEEEPECYRKKSLSGKPGGLIDFSEEPALKDLPVIIVPDLHGRMDFLLKLLDSDVAVNETGCASVLEALEKQKVIVVCVGDGIHGESRVRERWLASYADFLSGVYDGLCMREEMRENIATMQIVMTLKKSFTGYFHFLKGNHENIMNQDSGGNYSFRKFAQEGMMVRRFVEEVYGDAVLHLIDVWEKMLPICAVFDGFVVTHAEPAFAFSRDQVINMENNPDVIKALTWTANDCAMDNTCHDSFVNLLGKEPLYKSYWIGGHRPVEGDFALRQNGAYVQIHNPFKMNVAVLKPGFEFNPETDIRSVEN